MGAKIGGKYKLGVGSLELGVVFFGVTPDS